MNKKLLNFFVVAITFFLSLIWIIWLEKPDFPLDDAYIIQHSANGILKGYEDIFVGSYPIDGVTSPAFLLLICFLSILITTEWSQLIITAISASMYVVGVYKLSITYKASEAWSVIIAIISIIAGLSLYHLLNGLETGLAMASIIWAAVFFHDPTPDRNWKYGILGVLPFIRPELGALSLMLFIRCLWYIRKSTNSKEDLMPIFGWGLAAALPFLLFISLNHGELIPNTVSAKVYFFAEGCRGLDWKLNFSSIALVNFLNGLGFAAAGFFALIFSRMRMLAFFFILVFLLSYVLRLPGALFHNWYRYLYLLVPFAIIGWVGFVVHNNFYVNLVGKIFLLIAFFTALLNTNVVWEKYEEGIKISRIELAEASDWISSNLSPNEVILIHDAGYISLSVKNHLVDLVGLKTKSSIETHKKYTWTACGRDPRAIGEIARQSGASYFLVLDEWDKIFRLTDSLRILGWSLIRADYTRGDKKRYKIYKIIQ